MPPPTATLLLAAVAAACLLGCAEGGLRLPRLRARGWIGFTAPALDVGGEVGLVMPLDPAFATVGSDEEEEPPPAVAIDLVGRSAACRCAPACGWELVERARALARLTEGGTP